MFGLINKRKALKNIELFLRDSFEEGCDIESMSQTNFTEEDGFKMSYLIRSKCFWSISHLMQYIEIAIENKYRKRNN